MTVPRPLILFLAFCGGAALFGVPLILAAWAFSGGTPGARVTEQPRSSLVAAGGSSRSGEAIGELRFTAFDLGFEPSRVEVVEPGRYAVTFTNDGALLHNISFADGTVIEAEAGQSATGEVIVPAEGLPYVCSIPGHAEGGMRGAVTVAVASRKCRTAGPLTILAPRLRLSPIQTRPSTHCTTLWRRRSRRGPCTRLSSQSASAR